MLNNETHTATRALSYPFLKKFFYKKNLTIRFKCNYGANVALSPHFFVCRPDEERVERENLKTTERVISTTKVKSGKKKRWLSFLYLAINLIVVGIVLAVQLSKEGSPSESISTILDVNWWFILLAFGTFVLTTLLDQIRFASLIHKATGVYRFSLGYKVGAVGRYYDTITPLATGGQPFQVVYMNKYGIKAGQGLSIAMGRYIFYQIVHFIFVTILLFRNLFINAGSAGSGASAITNGIASTFSWIGYAIGAVLIITILIITLNKRVGAGLIVGILKLLSKIRIGRFRIIKDYKKSFKNVMKTVNVWQRTTKEYSKSWTVIATNVICSALYFVAVYSMPYFIYCAFKGWQPEMWIEIVTMAIMVDLASAFNPIPMGTGTADISFTAFFAAFFTQGTQFWALIIWRILFYYIYIIQGVGIIIYDYSVGNRRLEKHKEEWMLPFRERLKYRKERRKK